MIIGNVYFARTAGQYVVGNVYYFQAAAGGVTTRRYTLTTMGVG